MAHFAKLNQDNIVITVNVLSNNELLVDGVDNEQKGIDFLNNLFNTNDKLGGTPFRKNYAGIGYIYNEEKDAFISTQPYPSWTLNEDTCWWEPPVAYPTDAQSATWNESTTSWDLES